MKGLLNGKILKLDEISDRVLSVKLEVSEKDYNKESGKMEWMKFEFELKAFSYVMSQIKKYSVGDYIDLVVDLKPRPYNDKIYYDVKAEGIIVSFEKKENW